MKSENIFKLLANEKQHYLDILKNQENDELEVDGVIIKNHDYAKIMLSNNQAQTIVFKGIEKEEENVK